MQNTYTKLTATELEDFLVLTGKTVMSRGLKQITRDFLWNHAVLTFGTSYGKDGKPIGPGAQQITNEMMHCVAKRISPTGIYVDKSTKVRNKIVF